MIKEIKKEIIKSINNTSTTEELVFELEKYTKALIKIHMKETKSISKVYNQKEFFELMRKRIKKHSIIIFDERGKDIFDGG